MLVNDKVQIRNEQGEMYMIKNELLTNANVREVDDLPDQEVMPWLL
ncbi:hypothetical protein J15TS10_44050 [Paenibacillus woosongensis]|uniref:Uncharacterized protein n=1 Tax=Paenibacillus woosongensis TaxID=307580 RepID=A0ABQ4MXC6_9BACL|nr:hypothetical protein J15TS10_44050 [Paenibacillus woosongensis]